LERVVWVIGDALTRELTGGQELLRSRGGADRRAMPASMRVIDPLQSSGLWRRLLARDDCLTQVAYVAAPITGQTVLGGTSGRNLSLWGSGGQGQRSPRSCNGQAARSSLEVAQWTSMRPVQALGGTGITASRRVGRVHRQ